MESKGFGLHSGDLRIAFPGTSYYNISNPRARMALAGDQRLPRQWSLFWKLVVTAVRSFRF
jgi:hypothetical protein